MSRRIDESSPPRWDPPFVIPPRSDDPEKKVLMTTFKVVIDADDLADARGVAENLRAAGYRVHMEKHEFVDEGDGYASHRRRAV